jgi:methylglutaconyl-CoA hydratase
LYELPKPTIAAVHGAAIAGGTGLATICDFTLAVPSAKFGYTEARIGFVPALVSAFLALQIGDKRSRDLLLTGRLFDANEAYRLGLVNEVVEPRCTRRTRSCVGASAGGKQPGIAGRNQASAWQRRIKPGWMRNNSGHRCEREARETADFRRRDCGVSGKEKACLVKVESLYVQWPHR